MNKSFKINSLYLHALRIMYIMSNFFCILARAAADPIPRNLVLPPPKSSVITLGQFIQG